MSEQATHRDRQAYRWIVWAHGGCPARDCIATGRCMGGLPGCTLMDWLYRFADLGWIPSPDEDLP